MDAPAPSPAPDPGKPRPRGRLWQVATPLAFTAAGVLLVTSAVSSRGTDLRPGRYDSLSDLARHESAEVSALRDQVASLRHDIDRLSAGVESGALDRLQSQVDALKGPAGLEAVRGPG